MSKDDESSYCQKKYNEEKKKIISTWTKRSECKKYSNSLSTHEIENLINKIIVFYEKKYSNEELTFLFKGLNKDLNDCINFDDTLVLTEDEQFVMNGWYRTDDLLFSSSRKILTVELKEKQDHKKEKNHNFSNRSNIKPGYFISSSVDGKIENESINLLTKIGFKISENCTLEELLNILDELNNPRIDYSDLKKCICNQKEVLELRNQIIELAALGLLYSSKDNNNYGHYRAKKLIEEFNEEYVLSIESKKIDEIKKSKDKSKLSEEFENLDDCSIIIQSEENKVLNNNNNNLPKVLKLLFPNYNKFKETSKN